jgi:hypothetical protein
MEILLQIPRLQQLGSVSAGANAASIQALLPWVYFCSLDAQP